MASRKSDDAELLSVLVECRERSGVSLVDVAISMATTAQEVARFELGFLPLTADRVRAYANGIGDHLKRIGKAGT